MPKCNQYHSRLSLHKKPNRLLIYFCRSELIGRKQTTENKNQSKFNDFSFYTKQKSIIRLNLLECLPYKYGPNCSLDCGHCKNARPCSGMTGKCTDGCQQGWTDDFCLTGMSTC